MQLPKRHSGAPLAVANNTRALISIYLQCLPFEGPCRAFGAPPFSGPPESLRRRWSGAAHRRCIGPLDDAMHACDLHSLSHAAQLSVRQNNRAHFNRTVSMATVRALFGPFSRPLWRRSRDVSLESDDRFRKLLKLLFRLLPIQSRSHSRKKLEAGKIIFSRQRFVPNSAIIGSLEPEPKCAPDETQGSPKSSSWREIKRLTCQRNTLRRLSKSRANRTI